MSIETVDHIATALAKLPQQFRDRDSWIKTVTALVRPLQRLEETLQDMLLQRQITYATGAQLDDIGSKVGQPRNGETDDDIYRRYVRARIRANRSRGTMEDLIKISALIVVDVGVTFVIDNQGVAALVLRVEGVAVTAEVRDLLIGFLREAASAGVRVILETSQNTPANTFCFAGGAGRGFATTGSPGLGGYFASADD